MKAKRLIVSTDGGSRGNPGPAGAGAVITDEHGVTLTELKKSLGTMTNNEAEYEAVLLGLTALPRLLNGKAELKNYSIEVRLDSELVARQLSGIYQIKEARLYPYFIKIWNMQVKDYPKILFTHVPREKNTRADSLANSAMDEACLPDRQAGV